MLTCILESGSTPHLAVMGENRIGMGGPMKWLLLSINLTLVATCIELHRIAELLKEIAR